MLRSGTSSQLILAATAVAVSLYTSASGAISARPGIDWPQFRGIRAQGIDDKHPAPSAWNIEKKQGVVWKTAIPGLGHASPVVWGDSIYVATSISGKKDAGVRVGLYGDIRPVTDDTPHEWRVYCLDKLQRGRTYFCAEGIPHLRAARDERDG
jgi:hypothetical protein